MPFLVLPLLLPPAALVLAVTALVRRVRRPAAVVAWTVAVITATEIATAVTIGVVNGVVAGASR